jgi:hypothetical protein
VRAAARTRSRRRERVFWAVTLAVLVVVIAAMMVTSRTTADTDTSVSRAYGTEDKGMHPGLPGHSFVLVDAAGTQRWYGEYPSIFLSTADLLDPVERHLP